MNTAPLDEPSGLRVVFLDDDPRMRTAFVRMAALHGIRATAVETEAEVRAELDDGQADLAVLDFDLGTDRGTSAALAAELSADEVLVVVWTGNPERARDALGDAIPVVEKAGDIGGLFGEVARLIRGRAAALAAAMAAGEGAFAGDEGGGDDDPGR
ncbi:MAG: hypothetical protein KC619_03845 [Myxococcales bacterium]|nr:hypothetical protein [Myxococcales bacterium]